MKRGKDRRRLAKGIKDLTDDELFDRLLVGPDGDAAQYLILRMYREAVMKLPFDVVRNGYSVPVPEAEVPEFADTMLRRLEHALQQALSSGNADYFRRLADSIEAVHAGPADPVRSFLRRCFIVNQNDPENWSPSEVRHLLQQKLGIEISRFRVAEMCKELGIALGKGRMGRPAFSVLPKSRTNSAKR